MTHIHKRGGKRYTGIVRYLQKPGSRWAMTSGDILTAIGLKPGHPIPADAIINACIGDVLIRVRPKMRKGMEKRVFACCPECSEWIEAGHLHQHVEARHA